VSHSQSLTEFVAALGLAEALLDLEKQYSDPPDIGDQQTVEGLRGGAVVLMVAAFENFLKTAIVEHLTKLTTPTKVPFSKLPEQMLAKVVFSTLEHAMKGPPSRDRFLRVPDIEQACRDVISQTINPLHFNNTRSNPDPDTVKTIFAEIGKKDVFKHIRSDFEREWSNPVLKPVHPTFIDDKLDEIVNRRHVVAHTASALNITRSDLEESISFLKVLARVLDLHLEKHVEGIKK
jgi:hypothetical protein